MRTDSRQHFTHRESHGDGGRTRHAGANARTHKTQNSPPRVDAYPTRSSLRPRRYGRVPWIERSHPTVWRDGRTHTADGPFAADGLDEHADRGYTIVPGLLSPTEVQRYWRELEQLSQNRDLADDPRVVRERGTGAVRSIFEVHRISEAVAALARDRRVLDGARQLLGSDVYIHQSRINYMPGFAGKGFYWHSDFETWHAEDGLPSPRAVSLQIALTDNYACNGGLMLVPGSHRHFVPGQGQTPQDNYTTSLVEQQVGVPSHDDITELVAEYGIEQFTGAAGTGLWFDANIMHGSGNNITPYPRSNIFLAFNSVENAPAGPYEAAEPRPGYIAARDHTPIRH